jgi:S-adenosylmethionine hydrolase
MIKFEFDRGEPPPGAEVESSPVREIRDVSLHVYENSNGLAEIAVNQGRADRDLGLTIGNSVEIVL